MYRAGGAVVSTVTSWYQRGYVSSRACALRLCKLLLTVKILLFLTRDFLHVLCHVQQEMLGGLNRFKTHLISFIGNLLETVQKQKKQECDLESFIYTTSMHEINADSLRADHDSRFII